MSTTHILSRTRFLAVSLALSLTSLAAALAACGDSESASGPTNAAGASGSAQGGTAGASGSAGTGGAGASGAGGAGTGGAGAGGAGAGGAGAGAGGAGAGGAGAGGAGAGGSAGASGSAGAGGVVPDGIKVTDGPLPSGAKCDPIGPWMVTWGPPTEESPGPSGWCTEPVSSNLEVVADEAGALYVRYAAGTAASLSGDGCQLTAKSSYKQTNPSEYWYVESSVDLTIDGDTASGTYAASNTGFCVKSKKGPATAVRVK